MITKMDLKGKKENKKKLKEFDGSKYRVEITPELLTAQTRTKPVNLPNHILLNFKKIFSKYKRIDIYNNGFAYMKLYSVLHGSEKPSNLLVKGTPFQNSVDLQYQMPELKFQTSPRKTKSEDIEKEVGVEPINSHKGDKKDEQVQLLNYDQNMVIAYMYRKFPESYNIMNRMLHEISLKYPNFKPNSMLDYGAGLSPSGMGFYERYPLAELIFAVEPNVYMRKMGKHLTREIESFVWGETLQETAYLGDDKKFDLTVCSFVLEEVASAGERIKIINALLEKTTVGGFMVVVLPGSPTGFRYLNDLREKIRKQPREEMNIIAPCPHHERCPLAGDEKTWCRFEQTWSRYPKTVLPKMPEEEMLIKSRFCYLIVRKGVRMDGLVDSLGQQSLDWDRIIKPVKRRGKHSIVFICNRMGKLEQRTVAKSHEKNFGYMESKVLKWGDLWKFPLRIPNRFRKEARDAGKSKV